MTDLAAAAKALADRTLAYVAPPPRHKVNPMMDADLEMQRLAHAVLAALPTEREDGPGVGWQPIEEYVGCGPVMVSTAPDSQKYLFSEPVSAFRDVAGVWRCLGSIGGGAELARQPTHFRPLPKRPDLIAIEKETNGEVL